MSRRKLQPLEGTRAGAGEKCEELQRGAISIKIHWISETTLPPEELLEILGYDEKDNKVSTAAAQFIELVEFDDCKGNNKLNFEVSNPDFKVEHDGSLVALRNISEAVRALFVHARSEHAEDMAEILIVGANEKHSALK
ncbi:PREDICTED: cadherin-13, partial [Leptosomus discolor]|uniref:cadherin-13 n=1 Tax=Leptosomus discolor TaxID=188344 RepID=UPI000522419E